MPEDILSGPCNINSAIWNGIIVYVSQKRGNFCTYATGGGLKDEVTSYPFADPIEKLVELSAKGQVSEFDRDALKRMNFLLVI